MGKTMVFRISAIIVLILVAPFAATATDVSFDITSAKTAFIDDGILYVSAGYPKNHEGFQEPLKRLWENAGRDIRNDHYGQPWREVSIAQLERVFGSVDERYLAIYGKEVYAHKARNAFLWRWSCDGVTLVPVLDLGPHKFKTEPSEWGVDAFGVTLLPEKLEIRSLDKTLIPKEFYNSASSPGGWELWVNGTRRFSYMDRNQEFDTAQRNQLLDHESNTLRIIVEKSPLDERC